ncbi:MAG: hypothetical protein IPH75_08165 [bacterium]|nr:hypothetical protein [bacterium]
MTSKRNTVNILAMITFVCLASCSEKEAQPIVKKLEPIVVADDFRNLKDGEQIAYRLTSGTYKMELTSGNGTAVVEWVGAPCPKSTEVTALQTMCELVQDGQLLVTNPTSFGNGPTISVTIKITRMPHA